jgi:ABC-type multidrug transport system permease subunit
MRGYWNVVFKEFMHLRRDPTTLVIALLIPVLQLTIFGFAIDFDIRYIRTVVVDMDRSRESRAYVQSLQNTHYLEIAEHAETPEQAEEAMRRGRCRVAVIIPPDFARRSRSSERAEPAPVEQPAVRVLLDGSDSQVATPARLAFFRPPSDPGQGRVEARLNVLYNPQMRTETFMIPGLIGVILQLVTVSLTSFSLVREREQGTLEQLMVSPVGRLGLMVGKLTPYALLAAVEMAAVLLIGWIVFDVRVAGSLPLLLLLSVPFIVAALSLGLLISTVAQNQAQALQLTLLITLPAILMSGFVFPRDTMPGPLFLATHVLPLTFFLEILRGVIVRGNGLADLWVPLVSLVAIAAVLLGLSTARFRKSAG